jgi:hypothetical protein
MFGLLVGGVFSVLVTAVIVFLFLRQARREERDKKG